MSQFTCISSLLQRFALLGCYLFAAVFGIGVHAHETLLHHHDEIDEHEYDIVLHAHVDLGGPATTTAVAATESDHEHAVPMVQFAGVRNSGANQRNFSQSISLVSLAPETLYLTDYDGLVAEILPDTSLPLLSHITSILPSRAPPAA